MKKSEIIKCLDGLLVPAGFRRKNSTWNRSNGLIEVIDVQLSKTGDSITINIGILDRDVYSLVWGEDPPRFPLEPHCVLRARVGDLVEGTDIWWSLDDPMVDVKITNAVQSTILPFLGKSKSLKALEEWLLKSNVVRKRYAPNILSLAVIKGKLGKYDEAAKVLSEVGTSAANVWRSHVTRVSENMRELQKIGKRDANL